MWQRDIILANDPKHGEKKNETHMTDLLLLSNNRPSQLKLCLDSALEYIRGINQVYVIYHCDDAYYLGYEKLKQMYPDVIFLQPLSCLNTSFKRLVLDALFGCQDPSPYVTISSDQVIVKEEIILNTYIDLIQKTHAYGVYFHLGKEKNRSFHKKEKIDEGVYAWNLKYGNGPWSHPNALKMTLYQKIAIERDLKEMPFNGISSLIQSWRRLDKKGRIGLFCEKPKTFDILFDSPPKI